MIRWGKYEVLSTVFVVSVLRHSSLYYHFHCYDHLQPMLSSYDLISFPMIFREVGIMFTL